MAYDRYDTREGPRGERSRWRDDDRDLRGRGGREDRGFFERAGDEIASWFGDDDAERRRRDDQRMEGRDDWNRDSRRDSYEERGRFYGGRDRYERDDDRGFFGSRGYRGSGGDSGYEGSGSRSMWGTQPGREPGFERGFRPEFGGYTHSEGLSSPGSYAGEARDFGRGRSWREREPYGRDEYRRTSYSGSERGRDFDPHYHSWRQRQMDELDRDYDDYRRENQSRFESDFGGWRERRQQKRSMLGQIREHMEVVGNDDEHVGTIDRVAGDRIILTKSDPDSGGVHHSLSCSDIDRVEGERVILDCSSEQAKQRWRDESRSRALFEREDQGDMGDRVLDRSFEGTYR